MSHIRITPGNCSRARFNACQNQCRIAKFLDGGTIFDGNCSCEAPIECRFNLGQYFVTVTKDPEDEEFRADEAETALFPDVQRYIREVWSE